MVDKRVAVVLDTIHRLVAVRFQRAHGVVAMPFQQLADSPRRQVLVGTVGEHDIAVILSPRAHTVHVANNHIEIGTREVALVLVGNLKHGTRITAVGAATQLAGSSGRTVSTVAEGIIPSLGIHPTVNRINVEQVGVHRVSIFFSSTPPAVGHRVLTVIAVADAVVGAALAGLIGVLHVGVTVDDDTITAVGRLELWPQVPVIDFIMVSDLLVQGQHQLLVTLAQSGVVVAAGDRGRCLQA